MVDHMDGIWGLRGLQRLSTIVVSLWTLIHIWKTRTSSARGGEVGRKKEAEAEASEGWWIS